ncbi:Riboflavin transporter [Falsiruegeria litorea R37]|uniref:Riboflavin transporter n=1 Tax=Falsiruegeria litorea R37 TaxID=1200284 RepID=A0A1Y5SM46_9RHOB|nr:DMT family transporter [Falsiruegeria litorea]SLN43733.1 Riboflavin transporter [Falsiruegeria litorea R37]
MSRNLQGVLWSMVSVALFSTTAAMAKVAVTEYHVLQILFIRQIVVFLSATPQVIRDFPNSLRTHRPGIHAIRIAGAFVALTAGIWAVAVLPLATAVTLTFAQVFFLALLAAFFLGENVGRHRIAAIGVGFLGVLVAMRPGLDGFIDPYALIPVVGALGAATAGVCIRKLSQTEDTATLLIYQSFFVGLLAGIPLIWLWQTPDMDDLLFMIALGVIATIAQWIGVQALRLGEASIIGNVQYMKLIYASAFGFFFFAEIPDAMTLLGAAIIIASSLYIFHREAVNRARE